MELQALLVLGGAGVAIIAMILLAGLFSTAGTSYEDAVAQQRKATTELLALATNKNKPKKAKKANKKVSSHFIFSNHRHIFIETLAFCLDLPMDTFEMWHKYLSLRNSRINSSLCHYHKKTVTLF